MAVEQHDADLIIGSRMLSGESEMPLVRRIGNTIFAAMLSVVGSRKISDSASGMRVFRRESLPILYPLPDGLDFTPAMSTRAVYEGLNMVEVAIPYKERVGRSKLNPLKDGIRFLRSILWTALLYDPQRFFAPLGLVMLVLALLLGLGPTWLYLQNRHLQEDMIYRLFAVLILSVAGVNLLAFGATCQAILGLLPARRRPLPVVPRPWRGRLAGIGGGDDRGRDRVNEAGRAGVAGDAPDHVTLVVLRSWRNPDSDRAGTGNVVRALDDLAGADHSRRPRPPRPERLTTLL